MRTSNFSSWGSMRYCFDIDGTICETPIKDGKPDYENSKIIPFMRDQINSLYDEYYKN